jgi:hypothetical protein
MALACWFCRLQPEITRNTSRQNVTPESIHFFCATFFSFNNNVFGKKFLGQVQVSFYQFPMGCQVQNEACSKGKFLERDIKMPV